jgi:predicted nucleic acid-binding protein
MPVVDASVWIALFKSDEPDHKASRAWLAGAQRRNEVLVAPAIVLAEVAAALSRGLGNLMLAHRAMDLLVSVHSVRPFPVTEALALRAGQIAAEHRIRGCDAVYVALAHQLAMPLVTLDRQQRERGAAVVETQTPQNRPR